MSRAVVVSNLLLFVFQDVWDAEQNRCEEANICEENYTRGWMSEIFVSNPNNRLKRKQNEEENWLFVWLSLLMEISYAPVKIWDTTDQF